MQKKGISRRIDELGRIVIPKEIRRNLKIRESDELDITIDGENIILNKHEVIENDKVVDEYIKLLGKYINKNILFTSKDKVLSSYLIDKNNIDTLDNNITELILNRKKYDNTNSNIINLDKYYIIDPIIINGDLLGSIICYSNNEINEKERNLLDFTRIFLEKHLEYE